MTVENLFSDVLNNLTAAQYESFKFSHDQGAKDPFDLPVPTAEIREITLNINYAYDKNETPSVVQGYDIPLIFDKIIPVLKNVLHKAQKEIIDSIDDSDMPETTGGKWPEMKKNMMAGHLTDFMLDDIKGASIKGLDNLFNKPLSELSRYGLTTANLLAPLLEGTVQRHVIAHPELSELIKRARLAWPDILKKIKEELIRNLQPIEGAVNTSLKIVPNSLNIIVDSEKLKSLPPDAIQHAQVTVKMRNLFVEKNKEP